MIAELRSWWQKNKQLLTIATVIILALLLVFALAVYRFGWDWTGFTAGPGKITKTLQGTTTEYSPGKNFWDWMQLLLIPILLAISGFWLNQIQKDRDQKAEEVQKQREVNAAKEKEELESANREDNQRETALQGYIDKMSELLLKEDLRESSLNAGVRVVARARTMNVLRRLDRERKGGVIQFLSESHLLSIVDLSYADLSEANLFLAKLAHANLFHANLRKADLCQATLDFVNLSEAYMPEVDLRRATLNHADLSGAHICFADLRGANLTSATLDKKVLLTGTQFNKKPVSLKHVLLTEPISLDPTRWPDNFGHEAAEAAGAICVDC